MRVDIIWLRLGTPKKLYQVCLLDTGLKIIEL